VAYEFGDLGNYGVAASFKAVQSFGNPIIISLNRAVSVGEYPFHIGKYPNRIWPPRLIALAIEVRGSDLLTFNQASPSLAIGVGKYPDPITAMGQANVGRSNTMPFCIKPDRGQVTENGCKPPPPHFQPTGL